MNTEINTQYHSLVRSLQIRRRRQWQPTPVFLPGESQGRRSLVGCRLWGRTVDTTEATSQQQQEQLQIRITVSVNFDITDSMALIKFHGCVIISEAFQDC